MFELILFALFALNTAYVFILSVAGIFYKPKNHLSKNNSQNKIAILIPCYKEDAVIQSTVENILKSEYPKNCYSVFVIADSLKPETIIRIEDLNVNVIKVSFEKSMKCKSLNFTFDSIKEDFEIALILDADNLITKDYLQIINDAYNGGETIVQGMRVAKNLDTSMAMLDGLSEGINNHLFRKGANALGLSSALIGSGMSFPFKLIKKEMRLIESTVEDKMLQQSLTAHGYFIHFRNDIIIFDEKVQSTEAYKNQRRRWIGGQYLMLKENFFKSFKLLFKGNTNFFNIAFCQNFFPSRINSLILFAIICPTITLIYFNEPVVLARWWSLLFIYVLALVIAAPKYLLNRKLLNSMLLLPFVIIKTLQAIFQSKNSNKQFIHTEHKNIDIDINSIQKKIK
jgi:cellulose synthase/poly-beta-1,6-N-acetylglucosamine synthase-like glycosyltransferase